MNTIIKSLSLLVVTAVFASVTVDISAQERDRDRDRGNRERGERGNRGNFDRSQIMERIMERYREIGMLRALGMRASAVLLQIVAESTLIMLLGVAIGAAAGGGLCLWLSDGIDLSAFAEGLEGFGMASSVLVPMILPADVVFVVVASVVMGIVASFFPALRAVRLNPLEAMRH